MRRKQVLVESIPREAPADDQPVIRRVRRTPALVTGPAFIVTPASEAIAAISSSASAGSEVVA